MLFPLYGPCVLGILLIINNVLLYIYIYIYIYNVSTYTTTSTTIMLQILQ